MMTDQRMARGGGAPWALNGGGGGGGGGRTAIATTFLASVSPPNQVMSGCGRRAAGEPTAAAGALTA